jgi:hypothetical protein
MSIMYLNRRLSRYKVSAILRNILRLYNVYFLACSQIHKLKFWSHRYRIEVIVADHTTQGRFILFDRDVEQIVGMQATQLAQKMAKVNFIHS